jgi:hypothetical protein
MATMTLRKTLRSAAERPTFVVVHPLDDVPEVKRTPEGLGHMPMSPSVLMSLMALRGYLIGMGLLVLYHCLDLAGVFGHAAVH